MQKQAGMRHGRPRAAPKAARSNRVVTFVTNQELDRLEQDGLRGGSIALGNSSSNCRATSGAQQYE